MSIHVCNCSYGGRHEAHLRYPGMTQEEAQKIADQINGGCLRSDKVSLTVLEDLVSGDISKEAISVFQQAAVENNLGWNDGLNVRSIRAGIKALTKYIKEKQS